MTSQSPRIYIYKITFEEVPYYYYGVHKERKFGEYYMGSPVTNKWAWELYIPKKQILQLFDFTDKGWIEAQEVEKRLIKPFFNTDKWCLNENCGGIVSLEMCINGSKKAKELGIGIHSLTFEEKSKNGKKGGKISGKKTKELGIGIHGRTPEQRSEDSKKAGKIGGKKAKELGLGVHGRTKEQMTEDGKKGGKIAGTKNYEMKIGIHGRTKEQMTEDAKKGSKKAKELGVGIFDLSPEQLGENGKKGVKKTNSQKWMCLETGFITNPGNLTHYQRARGIDTSKRIRIM